MDENIKMKRNNDVLSNKYFTLNYLDEFENITKYDLQEIVFKEIKPIYILSRSSDNVNNVVESVIDSSVSFFAARAIIGLNKPGYFHDDYRGPYIRPIQLFQTRHNGFELVTFVPETPEDRARKYEYIEEPSLNENFDIADMDVYERYQKSLRTLGTTPLGLCIQNTEPCTREDLQMFLGENISILARIVDYNRDYIDDINLHKLTIDNQIDEIVFQYPNDKNPDSTESMHQLKQSQKL